MSGNSFNGDPAYWGSGCAPAGSATGGDSFNKRLAWRAVQRRRHFGKALRAWRKGSRLTQREAAERAGVDRCTWVQWEKGSRELRWRSIDMLSERLGLDILFHVRSEDPGPWERSRGQ